MANFKRIYNKLFLDNNGKFVIAQTPNIPLIIWFLSLIGAKLPLSTTIVNILSWVSFAGLILWASLEILYGVNYFRRFLGAIVLVFSILMKLIK